MNRSAMTDDFQHPFDNARRALHDALALLESAELPGRAETGGFVTGTPSHDLAEICRDLRALLRLVEFTNCPECAANAYALIESRPGDFQRTKPRKLNEHTCSDTYRCSACAATGSKKRLIELDA